MLSARGCPSCRISTRLMTSSQGDRNFTHHCRRGSKIKTWQASKKSKGSSASLKSERALSAISESTWLTTCLKPFWTFLFPTTWSTCFGKVNTTKAFFRGLSASRERRQQKGPTKRAWIAFKTKKTRRLSGSGTGSRPNTTTKTWRRPKISRKWDPTNLYAFTSKFREWQRISSELNFTDPQKSKMSHYRQQVLDQKTTFQG